MTFSAERYLVHVESPEITPKQNKKAQVIDCIMKYFDMHLSSHLSKERLSCKTYIESILTEEVLYEHSVGDLDHTHHTEIQKHKQYGTHIQRGEQ